MTNKYCFVIVGPTAAGKTNFALQLAKHFDTQIISADSRQCYNELTIGVAKPLPHELAQTKHYFINTHSIHQPANVKLFETYADGAAEIIFKSNDKAIMVGGTGLYINAFCQGIDEIPLINIAVRNKIVSTFETQGIAWLQNEIKKEDPFYFEKGEIKNPQRLMRALEVKLSTGRSIIEFQKQQKKKNPFKIIKIGLALNKEQLHKNIHARVDAMMQQGLLKEVEGLLPYKSLSALNTVGYRELFAYLQGEISLDESIATIKLNTRHYAKRQMTWFKKDSEITWTDPSLGSQAFINLCTQLVL